MIKCVRGCGVRLWKKAVSSFHDCNGEGSRMREDPYHIVEYLVQELGHEGALKAAIEGVATAQGEGDNYGLSIWREVKRILKENKGTS